ncbi:MAG: GntR family transcriptional regulator [Sulfitobacter sp.]
MRIEPQKTILDMALAAAPQVYRIMRQRIIRGDLEPGTRISESEIALAYGVSRQPAREAFIKLADEGLVEVRPQRGTYVRKIVISAVMDARFVREAIEADIVKLLAAEPNATLVSELRAQLKEQRKAAGRDSVRFIELDELFHRTLAQAAGKDRAWFVVESNKAQMDRVRYLATQQFPMKALTDQHEVIVDAINRGDVSEAEARMRLHLQAILKDLPEVARARPDFFESGD